jgi:translation initiation factor IF-1
VDAYNFGLALGAAGFAAMAIGSAAGAHGRLGRGVRGRGQPRSGQARAVRGTAASRGSAQHLGGAAWRFFGALASPRVAFSAILGFGATGMLLRSALDEPWLAAAAILGGIAFERFLIAPFWRFLSRFESVPALTLESCVEDEARAVTGFDMEGHGLVAVELDGHIVQLLAVLSPRERGTGVTVRAGDRLRIEAVDTNRNRCTVTYLGA